MRVLEYQYNTSLHEECIEIIENTSECNFLEVREKVVQFVDIGRSYNQIGIIDKALFACNIGWALLKCAQVVAEGALLGVQHTFKRVAYATQHPLQASKNFIKGIRLGWSSLIQFLKCHVSLHHLPGDETELYITFDETCDQAIIDLAQHIKNHPYETIKESSKVCTEGFLSGLGLRTASSLLTNAKKYIPSCLQKIRKVIKAFTQKKLSFSLSKLQAKFKHAADFGVQGNWCTGNAKKFEQAILQHIRKPNILIINGAYRNTNNLVTFYLDSKTGLTIIASRSGQFISGYKLSPSQIQDILTKKFLW